MIWLVVGLFSFTVVVAVGYTCFGCLVTYLLVINDSLQVGFVGVGFD